MLGPVHVTARARPLHGRCCRLHLVRSTFLPSFSLQLLRSYVARAGRVALLVSFLAPALSSCRTGRVATREAEVVSLTGRFSVVIGDPAPPAMSPQVLYYLAPAGGKTLSVELDSVRGGAAGDIRRFHGATVRVSGRYVASDSTRFRLEKIDSIPPRPS